MSKLLVLIVALFIAAPAAAEFTTAEKAEVHKLYNAQINLAKAFERLEASVYSGQTSAINTTASSRIAEAGEDLWNTIGHLASLDLIPGTPTFTRAEFVAEAMDYLDDTVAKCAAALAALPTPDPCQTCDHLAHAVAPRDGVVGISDYSTVGAHLGHTCEGPTEEELDH